VAVTSLVVLAIFLGALTRATFGFGEAVVSMPLLALLPIGLHTAASLVGLAGLTVAILSVVGRRPEIDRAALARLSVGTILGVPFGVALLVYVPGRIVAVVLGAVLAMYGVYNLVPTAARKEVGLQWAYPAGLFAGALGSAYNFTGVPVVVYGTLRGWRPAVFRGTLQVHFVIAGILVVAAQALGGIWTPRFPSLFALSLPAIAVGTWCGHLLHARIPAHRFTRYVYVLVFALGVVLFVRSGLAA